MHGSQKENWWNNDIKKYKTAMRRWPGKGVDIGKKNEKEARRLVVLAFRFFDVKRDLRHHSVAARPVCV